VLIIDDAQKDSEKKIVLELTFVQPVMSVRLRMDRLSLLWTELLVLSLYIDMY